MAMINAASQRKALRAIPKLVVGLILAAFVAFAAPTVCGHLASPLRLASAR